MRRTLLLAAAFLLAGQLPAQQPAPITRPDPQLDAAEALIGRALFLRCFCADNNLAFDAAGHTADTKTVDWTLAAADIKQATRKSPAEIELTGVRVALRYAADRREWERHPQPDEKLRIIVADPGTPAAFARTLDSVFAQGIDPRLQRAMPAFWQHFFTPQLPWLEPAAPGVPAKPDTLATTQVFIPSASTPDTTPPVATHRVEPTYTGSAQHDRVKGQLMLRLIVDSTGEARHIAVLTPLGYGLDAATVAAVERYRFTPGTHNGQPAAVATQLTQEFVLVNVPH